jgi:SAM-dependent methyltransferase
MNPEEYEKLAAIDRDHWFYAGKRAIVRHWISRYRRLTSDDVLVDGGMGTGTWLLSMARECRIIGLDDYEESLRIAKPLVEAAGGRAIKTGLGRVDLPDGAASVVTLLDVLEHLDDDAGALREMARLTKPGGLIVITVPALQILWSDWDEVLHHRRRYSRRQLLELIRRTPGVELLHCAYTNTFSLLPIALIRMWRKLVPLKPGAPRMEDQIPAPWLNRILYQLYVPPACAGWWHPPAGVSLLAVMRRG